FRIFQEALANVAAHSRATQVTVRLAVRRGWLLMRVADNGRGIAAGRSDERQALGFRGMRGGAGVVRGPEGITHGRPRGTVVHAAIPLADRRRTPRDPWS